jgi:mono/diheme cytochrome c family protein
MNCRPVPRAHHNIFTSAVRLILLGAALVTAVDIASPEGQKEPKPAASQAAATSGKQTFVRYCASCHGMDGKGEGPAASAMKTPPPDLTRLARRHQGKYPAGYVGALLKFGSNFASHGSEDMPVWGWRFKEIDAVRDPTGQHHVDDVVAYIGSLQAK